MKIGCLFSGYGGLSEGVRGVLGGDVAWVSDIDKGARKVLAHRFPDVPNIGDITTVDWSQVEPVDVLTGGFPCQDVSAAGKRAGIRPGTRSGLWTHFAYAIDQLRPSLVVIENVRGLLSARAHSDVEPCPWCVGDDPDGALRALGAVLGSLAELGYDCRVHGLRAADVGAPHGRFRVFVTAHPAGTVGRVGVESRTASRAGRGGEGEARTHLRQHVGGGPSQALLPTPRAGDGEKGGPNQRGSSGDLMLPSAVVGMALLPTPACNDMGEGKTVEAWDEWTAKMKAAHGNGNGHGASLAIEAQRLLPTPRAQDSDESIETFEARTAALQDKEGRAGGPTGMPLGVAVQQWGQYSDAIARWEALTRPAPPPTETGPKGNPRLSPAFSEWLMGLPAGWITDVPGVTRNEALKLAGNGVVPQQAEAALRFLLTVTEAVA